MLHEQMLVYLAHIQIVHDSVSSQKYAPFEKKPSLYSLGLLHTLGNFHLFQCSVVLDSIVSLWQLL